MTIESGVAALQSSKNLPRLLALLSIGLLLPLLAVVPVSGQSQVAPRIVEHTVRSSGQGQAGTLTLALRTEGNVEFRQFFLDTDQSSATGYAGGYDVLVENGFVYRFGGANGGAEWQWKPEPIAVEQTMASATASQWIISRATLAPGDGAINYLIRATSADGTAEATGVGLAPGSLAITSSTANYDPNSDVVSVEFSSAGRFDRKIILIDADNNQASGYSGGFEILVENGSIFRHIGAIADSWQWEPSGTATGPLGAAALQDSVQWTLPAGLVQPGVPLRFVLQQDQPNIQRVSDGMVSGAPGSVGGEVRSFTLNDDTDPFANPERGLYLYSTLSNASNASNGAGYSWSGIDFANERAKGRSLILLLVELENEIDNESLSPALKTELASTLAQIDDAGFKVVFRARYKSASGGRDEPEMARIQNHISELAAIIAGRRSAVAFVEAGMIGAWGEWHASGRFDLTDNAVVAAVANGVVGTWVAELNGTYVGVRRPRFKVDAGLPNASKVGHYNDCFLYNATHRGTYDDGLGLPGSEARRYLQGDGGGGDTASVPIGGETCGLEGFEDNGGPNYRYAVDNDGQPLGSTSAAAIDRYAPNPGSSADICAKGQRALRDYRFTYLNNRIIESEPLTSGANVTSYWPWQWRAGGCWASIQKDLGYRFDLQSVTVAGPLRPGAPLQVSVEVANKGYAKLYRTRAVELVFLSGGQVRATVPLSNIDPTQWLPGTTLTQTDTVTVPALPLGSFTLGLRMADPFAPENPRHSVRFANDGWNETLGVHEFTGNDLQVQSGP